MSFGESRGAERLIRKVAVIGAGTRGRAFAIRCAAHGTNTLLQDVLSSRLRKAEAEVTASPLQAREHLRLAASIEDAVREADLAIDFVPDELESKLEIFSLLDRMAPPRTILCTPTQLSISDLASCTYRADRCFALVGDTDRATGPLQVVAGRPADPVAGEGVLAWLRELGYVVTRAEDPRSEEFAAHQAKRADQGA